MEPRPPRLPPTVVPAKLTRYSRAPLLSGSSAKTSPPLVPPIRTRFPLGNVFKIGELPMSISGPIGLVQASLLLAPPQPPMKTSFSVAWYDHRSFPVLMSTAMIASVVIAGGDVVASPVPKYTACRTGSIVGEFHTAPPAGLYKVTPLAMVLYGVGSSGTTHAFQISLPVLASRATTLPREVQHG